MMRRLLLAAALLVLPLAALLFAQWPLRELVHAWSREANDLAQIVFALFMAVAVTAASRAGAHLSTHHHQTPPARWRDWAVLACLAPWCVFVLWTSAPAVWASVAGAERFAETFNPGYFVIKAALWLMVVLVLADALWRATRSHADD